MRLVKKKWLVPGDAAASELEANTAHISTTSASVGTSTEASADRPPKGMDQHPVSAIDSQQRLRRSSYSIASYVQQASECANVPFLAILPKAMEIQKPDLSRAPTVRELIETLETFDETLMHKWRGDILLISYAPWFFKTDVSIPYAVVKEFLSTTDVDLAFPMLTKLMNKIDDQQMAVLSDRYRRVRAGAQLRPFMQLSKTHPQILSESGMAIDLDVLHFLQNVPGYQAKPEVREGRIERLRFMTVPLDARLPNLKATVLEAQVGGKWVDYGRVYQRLAP